MLIDAPECQRHGATGNIMHDHGAHTEDDIIAIVMLANGSIGPTYTQRPMEPLQPPFSPAGNVE